MSKRDDGLGSVAYDAERQVWRGAIRVGGRRLWARAKTKAEVSAKLLKKKADVLEPPKVEARLPETVAALLTRWLGSIEHLREPKTIETYGDMVRLHIIPTIGGLLARDLTAGEAQKYLIAPFLRKERFRMAGMARDVLRNALNWAIDIDETAGITKNIARNITLPSVQVAKRQPYTPAELRVLFPVLEEHRLGPLFITAVGCGLRKGEVSGLKWTDVDLDTGILTVQRSLSVQKGSVRLADTKTHKIRQVDMPDFVSEALRKHREVQSLEKRWHGSLWENKHGLIFTTEIGTPVDPHNLLREWKKLLKVVGLRYTTIHDLRHGGASLIRDAGGTLQDISEILGHSSIAITSRLYVHLFPERRRDLMNKVGKVISG